VVQDEEQEGSDAQDQQALNGFIAWFSDWWLRRGRELSSREAMPNAA
jgi:hypothetical protein